jgi:hypothetical protein
MNINRIGAVTESSGNVANCNAWKAFSASDKVRCSSSRSMLDFLYI